MCGPHKLLCNPHLSPVLPWEGWFYTNKFVIKITQKVVSRTRAESCRLKGNTVGRMEKVKWRKYYPVGSYDSPKVCSRQLVACPGVIHAGMNRMRLERICGITLNEPAVINLYCSGKLNILTGKFWRERWWPPAAMCPLWREGQWAETWNGASGTVQHQRRVCIVQEYRRHYARIVQLCQGDYAFALSVVIQTLGGVRFSYTDSVGKVSADKRCIGVAKALMLSTGYSFWQPVCVVHVVAHALNVGGACME